VGCAVRAGHQWFHKIRYPKLCVPRWKVSRTEQVNANLAEKQLLSYVRLVSTLWRKKRQLSINYLYNVSKIQNHKVCKA